MPRCCHEDQLDGIGDARSHKANVRAAFLAGEDRGMKEQYQLTTPLFVAASCSEPYPTIRGDRDRDTANPKEASELGDRAPLASCGTGSLETDDATHGSEW